MAGQERRFAAVIARCEAASLGVQVPVAGAASVLFAVGGYSLAGWVSVSAGVVPLALLAIPLAGAAGALVGGPAARLGPLGLTILGSTV